MLQGAGRVTGREETCAFLPQEKHGSHVIKHAHGTVGGRTLLLQMSPCFYPPPPTFPEPSAHKVCCRCMPGLTPLPFGAIFLSHPQPLPAGIPLCPPHSGRAIFFPYESVHEKFNHISLHLFFFPRKIKIALLSPMG